MKKKILYLLGIATLLSSCSENTLDLDRKKNDDSSNTSSTTTFIGGTERTRTSLNMTYPGGTRVDYFWEPDDYIYTAYGDSAKAQITATAATAKFVFNRSYLSPSVTVYYPGGRKNNGYNNVVISAYQSQTGVNSTKNLGKNGDCGVATAQKRANGTYQFSLDHKSTVLCFLPYTQNNFKAGFEPRVVSIKVTADNNIAGNYTLTPSGLTGSGSKKEIELYVSNGGLLTHSTPNQSLNAYYMVIAPGTYKLKVEYKLSVMHGYDAIVNKTIDTHTYLANTVYPIEADLTLKDFSERKNQYYMWDAKANYWYNDATGTQFDNIPVYREERNNNYPNWSNPTDSRFFNPSKSAAVNSCKDCPTFAAATWYVFAGDPHWDLKNPWFYNGRMFVGGIWFKKWQYITATDPNGNTKSTTVPYNNYPQDAYNYDYIIPEKYVTEGQPIGALWDSRNGELPASEYFYLPFLGYMNMGGVYDIGNMATYWTSTPYKNEDRVANSLLFRGWSIEFNASAIPEKTIGQQIWTMK